MTPIFLPYDRATEFHDGAAMALQLVAAEFSDDARWRMEYNAEKGREVWTHEEVTDLQRKARDMYASARIAHACAQGKRAAARESLALMMSEPF